MTMPLPGMCHWIGCRAPVCSTHVLTSFGVGMLQDPVVIFIDANEKGF